MGICQYSHELTAYLDGEVSAVRQRELEAHLVDCPACDTEMRQLRGLSRLFAATQGPVLRAEALLELHGRVADLEEERDQAERSERRVLRITRVLTGIAACLLLAGSLWLSRSRQQGPTESRGTFVEVTTQTAPWDLPAAPVEASASASSEPASPADATADWMIGGLVASSPLPGSSGSAGEGNE